MELERALADFLEAQRVARLATVGGDGLPHVLPVCYALLRGAAGDALYSVVDEKPKRGDPRRLGRLRHLRRHPRAALLVDAWDEEWSRLAWVMVKGEVDLFHAEARLEPAPGEEERALEALRRRYPQYRTMALEGRPLIRLRPTRVLHWGGPESPLADLRDPR